MVVQKDSSIVAHMSRKYQLFAPYFYGNLERSVVAVSLGQGRIPAIYHKGGLKTLKFTCAKDLSHLKKVKKLIEHAFSFVIDEVSYHGEFLV